MDNGIDSETLHQPVELFCRHGTKFIRGSGPCKVTGFYAFVKKQEAISFPKETFDLRCGSAADNVNAGKVVRVSVSKPSAPPG